jgi:threonine dehydrogenase-like Zn-dependent dehydrogenase
MKMKAGVFYGPGDIRIENVDKPRPGDKGMLIKVGACGICPIIDISHYKMDFPLKDVPAHYNKDFPPNEPLILGHEFCGEVVEKGSKVSATNIGDRVYGVVWQPCGVCSFCRSGDYENCKYVDGGGRTINGAMAEYLLFPNMTIDSLIGDKFIVVPDTLTDSDGALVEPLVLSLGLANKAKQNDAVLVFGQDLMGLGITAYLKRKAEVSKIITCDISEKRLKASKQVGADIAVNTLDDNILEIVLDETNGNGADVVIETSCRAESLQQAVNVVKPFGKIWLGTAYTEGNFFNPTWQSPGMVSMNLTMKMGISIQCAWGTLGSWMPRIKEAISMIDEGIITAEKYATFFPLDQIKEAFNTAMDPHKSIKVILRP